MQRRFTLLVAAVAFAALGRLWLSPTSRAGAAPETVIAEKLELPPLKKSSGTAPKETVELQPSGTFTEFQRLTARTLADLPRTEDIRTQSQDFHFAPEALMKFSPVLGQIADAMRGDSRLVPQGIDFYDRCARSEEALTAVRVVCLHQLRYWAKKQPDVNPVRPQDYAEEVWRLSDGLAPITR